MSKRFIDTGIFDDPWFMDLSLSGKVLWLFCITKCNHAGILEMNERLCQFQTGIKSIDTVIKELSNRLIRVSEHYYFIPKYIEFQYPNFPQSKVRQQESAIKILKEFKLFDEKTQTLSKELIDSYVNVHDNVSVNVSVSENGYENFLDLFNKIKKSQYRGSDKIKRQYSARIKEGFTLEDFEKAIKNCKKDKFHRENTKYLTPEFITRSDKLEMYLNKQEESGIYPRLNDRNEESKNYARNSSDFSEYENN